MKTKYLLVSAAGMFTAIISFWVIEPAALAMQVAESSDIAVALLLLGVLLALGGSRVGWEGYKHFRQAS